jgi:superfamily II DNA or RNA helicase
MMPDAQGQGSSHQPFGPGQWVRLVGDPQRYGTFRDVAIRSGRSFARVQTVTGVVQWPLEEIEPVPTAREEPIGFLRDARFSEPARLRQVLAHIRLTGRLADVIYSMEATNTEFHAHQFKPVLKMLGSPTGSLLIADEVGLGKTIEAGLIWTELRARFDYRRLLVVCPKVLVTKWEAELSGKFGLDVRVYTAAELLPILRDRDRWARGFVAVCSLQGLKPPRGWDDAGDPQHSRPVAELARLLRDRADDEPVFDMVVVDEAHHLRNPETQNNQLGRLLRPTTQHQAFLSATPIHLRNTDLFSLLSLIDPETYRHESALREIIEANRPIVEAREAALAGAPVSEIRTLIEAAARHPLLAETQKVSALLHSLARLPDPLPRTERARLAGELEQVNLLANTVTRTRRRDVQELRVIRNVFAARAEMDPMEREAYDEITGVVQSYAWEKDVPAGFLLATPQRLLASCLPAAVAHWLRHAEDVEYEDEDAAGDDASGDAGPNTTGLRPLVDRLAAACTRLPAPAELERHDSKFHEFHKALRDFLANQPGEKAVVFSTFRPTLRYLARRLDAAGISCEVIHGEVADRDAALTRFEAEASVRVLLSSEVGSEGIDLQFCRTVFNYDLPWNPMRVEQRIGRVDRLGQAADAVTIVNLLHRGTIDDEIYRRLYERLHLCEQALGGFEAVLGEEIARLAPDLLMGRLTPAQMAHRIDQTSQAIENRLKLERQLEEEAAALIAHGDRITMAIRAAHEMHRWIGARDLARYLGDALASLFPGSAIRDLARDDTYEFRLTQEARSAYSEWLQSQRLPGGGRLERETGPVTCRLGRPPGGRGKGRGMETLTQTHPFVRFLAGRVADTDAPKLRPAVAARVAAAGLRGGTSLPPGRYAVLAMLWRFGGQVEQERIAYAGLSLADGSSIDDDIAERLLLSAAEAGALWPEAEAEVDCRAVADLCEARLLDRLTERFLEERATRRAEQDDRAAIQLRTLEQRLADQQGRQREIVERNRRSITQGIGDARRAGSAIAMAEGKLRKLEETAALRRAAIERARVQTAQEEQLSVAVIEVVR